MENKTQNQQYVSSNVRKTTELRLDKIEESLDRLFAHLATKDEDTIEEARAYQEQGADYKHAVIMDECRAYIKATNAPEYLQPDMLQRASEQISESYRMKLGGLLLTFEDVPLTEDNIYYSETRKGWFFTQSYRDEVLSVANKVLTDEQQEIFDKLIEANKLLRELDAKIHVQTLVANKVYASDDMARVAEQMSMTYRVSDANRVGGFVCR